MVEKYRNIPDSYGELGIDRAGFFRVAVTFLAPNRR